MSLYKPTQLLQIVDNNKRYHSRSVRGAGLFETKTQAALNEEHLGGMKANRGIWKVFRLSFRVVVRAGSDCDMPDVRVPETRGHKMDDRKRPPGEGQGCSLPFSDME